MKKVIATFLLLAACAAAILLAYKSYSGVNGKLSLAHDMQQTMKIEVTPTPTVTPTPVVTPTPTPEPVDPELPVLTLAQEELEITAGSSFYVISPVADITDNKDDRSSLFRRIMVHGDYNVYVPGEYTLEYVVSDSDGNLSIPKTLKLIVKAG